jgi:hypothetical protein
MKVIKEEMASFQNLFLNSGNIEDRRQSVRVFPLPMWIHDWNHTDLIIDIKQMLPPRAVSPMKLRRPDQVEDGISVCLASFPILLHTTLLVLCC